MSVEQDITEIKTILTGPRGVVESLNKIDSSIESTHRVADEAKATADQAKEIAIAGNRRLWTGMFGLIILAAGMVADVTVRRF